jgi:hypothetical protein
MSSQDDIAPLIPWYATGTLDPKDSARVESHIAGCDACRDLLVTARGFRRLGPQVGREALFDHIQSQRLVEFAEDPSALEPDARRFIRLHVRECPPCAEALEILEDMARAPAGDDSGSREPAEARLLARVRQAWSELWQRLGRTWLHPVPALVYLAALIVLLVLAPFRQSGTVPDARVPVPPGEPTGRGLEEVPAPRPPVSVTPPAIELPEEVVFRNGGAPPRPITVSPPAEAKDLVLDLVTSIESADLRDPASEFRLTLLQGDRVISESTRRGADFDLRGRLRLLIDPSALAAGVPCLARITLSKTGSQAEGEEVYRRSFVLASDDRSPR